MSTIRDNRIRPAICAAGNLQHACIRSVTLFIQFLIEFNS